MRAGDNPYVDPDRLTEESAAPYVYPPLLALVLVPATALPDTVRGSSPAAVLVSLLAIASIVGALLALDVRDWRCYPVALLYPPTVENVEYGAVGPILVLLVALGWRYRERIAPASLTIGAAMVLKVFLWPLVVWLAATRRWKTSAGAVGVAAGLALASWAAIGFRGLADYPELVRRLSDLEAENSYSAFAIFAALGVPAAAAHALVGLLAIVLLVFGWRAARGDAASGAGAVADTGARGRPGRDADPLAPLPGTPPRTHRPGAAQAFSAVVRAAGSHRFRAARLVPGLAAR